MGTPISKEELAARQKTTDDRWQQTIKLYQENYPDSEKECERLCVYLRRTGFEIAHKLFTITMMKLHIEIATETGEFLGPFEEDEEVDPSRN